MICEYYSTRDIITVYFFDQKIKKQFPRLSPPQSREVVPAVTGKSITFKLKIYTHEKTETRLRRGIATKNDSR